MRDDFFCNNKGEMEHAMEEDGEKIMKMMDKRTPDKEGLATRTHVLQSRSSFLDHVLIAPSVVEESKDEMRGYDSEAKAGDSEICTGRSVGGSTIWKRHDISGTRDPDDRPDNAFFDSIRHHTLPRRTMDYVPTACIVA